MNNVIAIGFSAGGLDPLREIVRSLPNDMKASVLITAHRSIDVLEFYLVDLLSIISRMQVKMAENGEPIECGRIYVFKPGYHLIATPDGKIGLTLGPKIEGFRPSINELFRTVGETFKKKSVGVVLSGCLYDGTIGLIALKKNGGTTIVQDLKEAEFPWMPLSAIEADGKIDYILKAKDIQNKLKEIAHD